MVQPDSQDVFAPAVLFAPMLLVQPSAHVHATTAWQVGQCY